MKGWKGFVPLKILAVKRILPLLILSMLYINVTDVFGANEVITMQSVDYESEFTIRKDEMVQFSDGLKLTFKGHGHKTVMAGGPSSPLVIAMEYDLKGKKDFNTYSVYPDENETWSWEGRYFYMGAYEYNSSMKLKVSHSATMRSVDYDSEFIIRRGETVKFTDGFKLTFNNFTNGIVGFTPTIHVKYEFNGVEDDHISDVDPDEGNSWEWEGRIFYVVDPMSNVTIKLKVVDNSNR
jgi:hypothetical protein